METHPWPALAEFRRLIAGGDFSRMNPAIFDALADRLEAALAAPNSERLREAADALQEAYYELASAAPPDVQAALRGAVSARNDLLSAFWAGQTAFAQLLASRALDKRAEDRFVNRLTDRRYERYIRALLMGPQGGEELAAITRERKETVSRKLGALARLGVVERQRQGNRVVNVLTPAARAYLKHRNIAPLQISHEPVLSTEVQNALQSRSIGMPGFMRTRPIIGPTLGVAA